jgi:hypothetical protein
VSFGQKPAFDADEVYRRVPRTVQPEPYALRGIFFLHSAKIQSRNAFIAGDSLLDFRDVSQ